MLMTIVCPWAHHKHTIENSLKKNKDQSQFGQGWCLGLNYTMYVITCLFKIALERKEEIKLHTFQCRIGSKSLYFRLNMTWIIVQPNIKGLKFGAREVPQTVSSFYFGTVPFNLILSALIMRFPKIHKLCWLLFFCTRMEKQSRVM